MPVHLSISPKIIPSIASLYDDITRIFMEYVDNSIDSADQYFFNHELNSYTKKILIEIKICGNNFKSGKVYITDNCFGITNFSKVVESIGDSDKKADFTTNGQFGFGIYSFMAVCTNLSMISKLESRKALSLEISKSQFDKERQDQVVFPDPAITTFSLPSGTEVCLYGFERHCWWQIKPELIKEEIEKHFEQILRRRNIEIRVTQMNDSLTPPCRELICQSFDYSKYEGDIVWDDDHGEFNCIHGRKFPKSIQIKVSKPIHIFLKILKGKIINKAPIFISRGRRIKEIKDILSFKSKHKSDLWSHPNITGFIDLIDNLEPDISRKDFKNTNERKGIYNILYELESLIIEEVDKINKKSEQSHYKSLEDKLNEALAKLARIDQMNYRKEIGQGNQINTEHGGKTVRGDRDPSPGKPPELPLPPEEDEKLGKKETSNETNQKGEEKRRSGFNINISDLPPDKDENNNPLRSKEYDGQITIYKKHPDFESRVKELRNGNKIISNRLITYLAGEIATWYKDKLYDKLKMEPLTKIEMFSSLVDFIYRFEEMLKDFEGKNLSEINN